VEEPVSSGTRLTATAEAQVDRLIEGAVLAEKQRLVLKNQVRNLRLGFAALLLLIIGLGLVALQAHNAARNSADTASKLQGSSRTSCLSGNTARATNKQLWDEFLTILISNPQNAKTRTELEAKIAASGLPAAEQQALDLIVVANWTNDPANVATARAFEAYIAAHEQPQNCTALYGS
jgi:hypothetical protein